MHEHIFHSLGRTPPYSEHFLGPVTVHYREISLYLAIDSVGNVSDLVFARNCSVARMLVGKAENGVGMNRSAMGGKKCEAL